MKHRNSDKPIDLIFRVLDPGGWWRACNRSIDHSRRVVRRTGKAGNQSTQLGIRTGLDGLVLDHFLCWLADLGAEWVVTLNAALGPSIGSQLFVVPGVLCTEKPCNCARHHRVFVVRDC